jgi:hypothetical protein
MPPLNYVRTMATKTGGAKALRNALIGKKVDPESLSTSLRLLECRTSTDFVREWTEELSNAHSSGHRAPHPYAANADEIDRIVKRLGGASGTETVDLAQLPVGQYLLAIHDCIRPDSRASYDLVLTADRLLDIAASGFLDSER